MFFLNIYIFILIDELIDIDYDENATKVTRLANYLRIGLTTSDITVMHMASKALGMRFLFGGGEEGGIVIFLIPSQKNFRKRWRRGEREGKRG